MIPVQQPRAGFQSDTDWLTEGVMPRRVLAWFADAVLIGILVAMAWVVCLTFGLLTLGIGWPVFGVLPALPILYHWLFVASGGAATPGQSLFGITVRREADLTPPSGLQALAFTLLLYLTLASGVLWLAVALVTKRHRTLHDLCSGVVVVRTQALTPRVGSWNMPFGHVPPGGPSAA